MKILIGSVPFIIHFIMPKICKGCCWKLLLHLYLFHPAWELEFNANNYLWSYVNSVCLLLSFSVTDEPQTCTWCGALFFVCLFFCLIPSKNLEALNKFLWFKFCKEAAQTKLMLGKIIFFLWTLLNELCLKPATVLLTGS